tara:strand:+ start:141 stop:485 length:345 start_codon:yes stop_codon:yes gene_type:complete
MPRLKKSPYNKYSFERDVTAIFDPTEVEGFSKLNRLDKYIAKQQFLRKQPEYLQLVFIHCEDVPCLRGARNKRFDIHEQTCLLCGFKFVPIDSIGIEMSNLEVQKRQAPYLKEQ